MNKILDINNNYWNMKDKDNKALDKSKCCKSNSNKSAHAINSCSTNFNKKMNKENVYRNRCR